MMEIVVGGTMIGAVMILERQMVFMTRLARLPGSLLASEALSQWQKKSEFLVA
jgi:hypothetical protein